LENDNIPDFQMGLGTNRITHYRVWIWNGFEQNLHTSAREDVTESKPPEAAEIVGSTFVEVLG
jgi:hypothetical protein